MHASGAECMQRSGVPPVLVGYANAFSIFFSLVLSSICLRIHCTLYALNSLHMRKFKFSINNTELFKVAGAVLYLHLSCGNPRKSQTSAPWAVHPKPVLKAASVQGWAALAILPAHHISLPATKLYMISIISNHSEKGRK